MSFLRAKAWLKITSTRHELEPVEAQDENDSGYLWAAKKAETVFDLNPEKDRFELRPEDLGSNTEHRSP